MHLSDSDKSIALEIARASIFRYPESSTDTFIRELFTIPENLDCKAGCFVSVYVEENLRGCIGTFSEQNALYSNIRRMAVSAAYDDDRFAMLERDEFSKMGTEISVLTPRRMIRAPEEIEVGRHGVYIVSGMNRGTLLPQVAERNNWTASEFLEHCARDKARIGPEGWKHAEVYTYEAIVFSDF